MQLTKQPSSGARPCHKHSATLSKITRQNLDWSGLDSPGLVGFATVSKRVLCSVSVLGAVAQKRRVITMTVDTIDSVITIGAVVTSIGIVIAMVKKRMAIKVVSFPWSIPSVSSEAFSFVPNWKYFWGFYDKCDYFDDDYCTHPWDTQRRQILWQRRPEKIKSTPRSI